MSDDPRDTIMDTIVVMRAPHQVDYWTDYFGVTREGKITRGRW